MNDFTTSIENICRELVNTFQDKLIWEWDDRFEAALATCKINDKKDIQLYLESHLQTLWDTSNTENAPDNVLDVISKFGGLMPGQLLFMSELSQKVCLCCAWWPWGDGQTVSIRVAPYTEKLPDEDRVLVTKKFKAWFGLQE